MKVNMHKFFIFFIILLLTQSCGPIVGGIGVVAIGSAAKEKGMGTAINDNVININILNAIYKWDEKVAKDLKINVDNGSVLITGKVKTADKKVILTKIVWEVKGVREVVNKAQISDMSNIKNLARDVASVGEIRARMLTNIKINSLNFSVDVVNDIAYLSGIASSEEEIKIVTDIAKKARFVKEVFSYIKVNTDKR